MRKFHNFDDVLYYLGTNGWYQKRLLYFVITPMTAIVPIVMLVPIFTFYIPNHWCHFPGHENLSAAELATWKNQSLPTETGPDGQSTFSQCQMYRDKNSKDLIDCPLGWDYDHSEFVATIASDFDWVCTKSHYATTIFTTVPIGTVIGNLVFGFLADRVGRRVVLIWSLCLFAPLRLVTLFIPQYFTAMAIVFCVSAIGYPMVNLMPALILAEICDERFRSRMFAFLRFVYFVGMAAVPGIAYLFGHWFYIGLATTLPALIIMYPLYLYLDESPRWLTSVGRTKEAAQILWNVAKANETVHKITLPQLESALDDIWMMRNAANVRNNGSSNSSVFQLLRKPRLRKHILLITFGWTVSNLIYDCITLNMSNMPGDQFLSFFLLAVVESPTSLVGGYLIEVVGRRWTAVVFFALVLTCCFVGAVLVSIPSASMVVTIAVFIAMFGVDITFLVEYLQATELMPTPLRATGNSFPSTISAIAAVFAPTIVFTAQYYAPGPYLAMGLLAILAVVSSAFLPETKGQYLPETIEEANDFGEGIPFWSFSDTKYRIRNDGSDSDINVGMSGFAPLPSYQSN